MKNRSRRKNRIMLLLVMMLSTAAFISTATYAWFTANKTVSFSEIQVNVEAQGGIQLSADGTNWKSIVSVNDIINADAEYPAAVNQVPSILEPVSSGLNVDAAGLMEMYYGSVSTNVGGDYILSATKDTETHGTTGRFVSFDLFFRSDSANQMFITPSSGVETPDVIDTGIKNSTRVAFVVLGETALGSTLPTIQGLNSGAASPVYLWEPNYEQHTAPATQHALDTYGIVVDANPIPYSGVIAPIDTVDDILLADTTALANPTFFSDVTPDYTTVNGFAAKEGIFTLNPGITKIRFYLWIEGQDVDTENSASGGTTTFNVQLTIDPS